MSTSALTVSQVAARAAVTVRALHYYDEIGLLSPSARSDAGYRLYSPGDLVRLRDILLFRQLGFALDATAGLIDAELPERAAAVKAQRARLLAEKQAVEAVITAVDRVLDQWEGGAVGELFEGFDKFAQYDDEAQQRWGETVEYKEANRRTRSYGKQQWAQIQADAEALLRSFAALYQAGVAPIDARAQAAAESARLHCDRWFYPCSRDMHAKLAELYVSDARFRSTYDNVAPGLADYVASTIHAARIGAR